MQSVTIGDLLNERMSVTLEIDGSSRALYLLLRWHRQTGQWTIGIQDEDGRDIITHIPILGNVGGMSSNILRIFSHHHLGSAGVLPIDDEFIGRTPDSESLSEKYTLVWGDTIE